jgi:outer membrane protein assembly factor BamB
MLVPARTRLVPFITRHSRRVSIVAALVVAAVAATSADNWPEWRGRHRDGRSAETGLPVKWSAPTAAHAAGENLAWRVPIGSRSSPVVFGGRVYVYAPDGPEELRRERLIALDEATGKTLWERPFSVYLTDIPAHRVAWASPSVDPATGNIYTFGGNAALRAFSPDGKLLWERGLVEDFGAITTHGGRSPSPVVDGDLVVVNTLISAWGTLARGGNRYFAFDKKTGASVWVSSPQQRHWDTNYATPVVATVNGTRLLIVGGTDGVFHALKVSTGEPVWRFDVSKRAINNSVVMHGNDVLISHSEENFNTNEMGMLAMLDAGRKGEIKVADAKWATHGLQAGFPTPVIDEKAGMVYLVDNGAVLIGVDLASGKRVWDRNLGTIQKGSPVLADGKLYVGTENGKVYILKPGKTSVEILDEDVLPTSKQEGTGGAEPGPEPIVASPVVANGRLYVASMDALYAIGPKTPKPGAREAAPSAAGNATAEASGPPAAVRVTPSDINLKPGQAQKFAIDLFSETGAPVKAAADGATWALEGLKGSVAPDGTFTPDAAAGAQGGQIKATVGGISGTARVRVVPQVPIEENFDAYTTEAPPVSWINTTGKFDVKDLEGNKVLQRREDNTLTRRARVFFGSQDMANYTVEMDVRTVERRRQHGDVGVIAQRYVFVLFGNSQRVELQPWQPDVKMTASAPFAWKPDTWYRVKVEVQNLPDGKVRARGKAWPRGEAEPSAWLVEKIDPIGHKSGSPGLYADSQFGASYDNIKVYKNAGS